jgi:hypothetical protein
MLFSTSLVAYVGAGDQPTLTPRKLALASTAEGGGSRVADVPFTTAVLSARLDRSCVVAVLERQAHVLDLRTLAPRPGDALPTPRNPQGLAALSASPRRCLLALPAPPSSSGLSGGGDRANALTGTVRVYDLGASGGAAAPPPPSVLCDVHAHRAPMAALAMSADASLLATASRTGTVVRVHRMPGGGGVGGGGGGASAAALCLRRGTVPAAIHSLAFSWSSSGGGGDGGVGAAEVGNDAEAEAAAPPDVLVVASGRGSIHVFRLDDDDEAAAAERRRQRAEAAAAGGAAGGAASRAAAAAAAASAAAAAAKAGERAARTLAAAAGGAFASAAARWRAARGGGAGGAGGGAPPAAAAAAAPAAAAASCSSSSADARRPALTWKLPPQAAGLPCVVGVRACQPADGDLDLDFLREGAAEAADASERAAGRGGGASSAAAGRPPKRIPRRQQYRVSVASSNGFLYVYRVEGLHDHLLSAAEPRVALVGTYALK